MESGKQVISPETSNEENNDRSDQVNSQTTAAKRSYECTYCKRGFTNAQALGGHMNIHRKDRAKAKQNATFSNSYSCHRNDQDMSSISQFSTSSSPPFSSPLPAWYQPTYNHVDHHSNYYHPSSGPSIAGTFPYGYSTYEMMTMTNHSLAMNEELMRTDLSLQIDSSRYNFDQDHDDRTDDVEAGPRGLVDDEPDLELRLGHR